jgi:feruloyl esterase
LDDKSVCTPLGSEPCTSANSEPGHIDNEREINYGYRAIHLTAATAKLVIDKHYDDPPEYSYFTACSNGGRQGLWEATTFPDDFDGILVQAPWINPDEYIALLPFFGQHVAEYGPLPAGKLDLITAKALEKCDFLDGIVDGILNQPSLCTQDHFNVHRDLPKCVGKTDGPDCFTSRELQFIAQIYKGLPQLSSNNNFQLPQEVSSAARVGPDILGIGSQLLTWEDRFTTPAPAVGTDDIARYFIFDDASLDTNTYYSNPIPHILSDLKEHFAGYSIPTTDLSNFMNSDGKVIFWHGWIDPTLLPQSTIKYYENMVTDVGGQSAADSFARLYMMPGVGHCLDGPGPQVTNMAQVLVDWVEDSTPPARVDALTLDLILGPVMGRPLCPYPMIAKQIGPENWDGIPYFFFGAPSSFECAMP